jgi:hypothetical protein
MRVLLKSSLIILFTLLQIIVFAQEDENILTIYVREGKTTTVEMMDNIEKIKYLDCDRKTFDYHIEDNNLLNLNGLNNGIKNCSIKVILRNSDEYKFKLVFTDKQNVKTEYKIQSSKDLKRQIAEQKNGDDSEPSDSRNSDISERQTGSSNTSIGEEQSAEVLDNDDSRIDEQINIIMTKKGANDMDLKEQVSAVISNFAIYLTRLGNRNMKEQQSANKSGAKGLFYKPDEANVIVIGDPKPKPLNKYLDLVALLGNTKYLGMKYEAKDIQIIGSLQPTDEEGVFKTIAFFVQDFTAVKKNNEGIKSLLKNKSSRKAEIIVKVFKKRNGEGKEEFVYKVYLQNISANKSE